MRLFYVHARIAETQGGLFANLGYFGIDRRDAEIFRKRHAHWFFTRTGRLQKTLARAR